MHVSAAPRAGWGVAVAATLGMSVSYIDRQTLTVVAPAVREGLGIDRAHYGWLLSAFSMAYFVCAPLSGLAVDKLGARRGFALAVVAWSLVAGAHAFATTFASLFALRVLLGATESPSFPAAAQAIRKALPGARRSAAYGLLFTGSSIGAMVAAVVAVRVEKHHGFRMAFVATALLGIAWLPAWLFATRGGRLDAPEAGASGPGTEDAHRGPAMSLAALRDVARMPAVVRSIVAIVGSAPGLMFVLGFTSQYLVETWSLPKDGIALHLVFPPLLFDVGAVGFGYLASGRTPRGRARTHTDLVGVAAALAAALALVPLAGSAWVAVLLLAVAAAGGGGLYVLVTSDMVSRVPVFRTSAAGGLTAAAQSLAHIVAAPLVGMAVDRTHAYTGPLVVLGVAVVPATVAFVRWGGIETAPPAGEAR